jgi:hypothetical protein
MELISNIWNWISQDLIGNEIVAGLLVAVVLFMLLSSIGIPRRLGAVFMIPVALGLTFMGVMSWFGWIIIAFAGMMFGYLVYKLYEGVA